MEKTLTLCLIGEAWGEHEERARKPFVGPAGWLLDKMLQEAGINRNACHITNVFNLRPRPTNDISNLCGPERTGGFPRLCPAGYLRPEYHSEVSRLYQELRDLKPNLAVLLGATACWALLGHNQITKVRGTACLSPIIRDLKCLPAYHPAAILRNYSLRPITTLDLKKARHEAIFPELRRPQRTIYIEPSLRDLEWYREQHLKSARQITFDIETSGQQITCIGFAPDHQSALIVPFTDTRTATGSYWPSLSDERRAWDYVRDVLNSDQPKSAQNGLYDISFLWRSYGITVTNYQHDTMLLHHALQPESEKSLGFLGSLYTNEASWKLMRQRGKTTIKRDE